MRQLIALVTLGIDDLARSRRFYVDGFGWKPVFETPEVIFYQMNGVVFSTSRPKALAADPQRGAAVKSAASRWRTTSKPRAGAAHPRSPREVRRPYPQAGIRAATWRHERRGRRSDEHAWEIAWNPAWPIDAQGRVRFGT